jgi:hypothetical protein
VKHTARAMPPSPEVMPHDTFGEVVANLLALRFAPRSCCRSRESITPRIPGSVVSTGHCNAFRV